MRPPQLDAVGVAEVGDQRAHVGARRALDRERRALAVAPELLEARHLDLALGHLDDLTGARQRVGALAADLDRRVGRRALRDATRRQLQRLLGHVARARSRPPGRRWSTCSPAARRSRSASAAPSGSAGRACRGRRARAAGRSRTGPACPAWPTFTPLPSRRRTFATTSCDVTPAGLSTSSTPSTSELRRRAARGRTFTSSGNSRSVEKPAARRWPPPPSARAITETSMRSSVARSETLRAGSPASWSRTSPATAVPSTERRWSTTPSE